jgi:hypothetical protein
VLHQLAYLRHQLAEGPDAARRRWLVEAQAELIFKWRKWIA